MSINLFFQDMRIFQLHAGDIWEHEMICIKLASSFKYCVFRQILIFRDFEICL